MTISELYIKMLSMPEQTMHDINHLTKVWAYARHIGCLEGLDEHTQYITEAAAILHDIACPFLRQQYGTADGKKQEEMGPGLARNFLADTGLPVEDMDRICDLIGHHHTPDGIDGPDYQILIEADYLVNADESGFSGENVRNMHDRYFRTASGRKLLEQLYL